MNNKNWSKFLNTGKLLILEEKSYFPADVLKKVKELTGENQHTEARIEIAKAVVGADDLIKKLEAIDSKHMKLGHLTPELNKERQKITQKLLNKVKAQFSNFDDVRRSL